MKMLKKMSIKIYITLCIASFIQHSFASDNEKPKRSYVEYVTHPTTLLFTGIATLGGCCWYDHALQSQTYEWSKQQFEWLKQQFDVLHPVAKWATAGLGAWGLYTYWFNKKKAREEKKAQESLKKDHAILKAEFILLKSHYEVLKEGHQDLAEKHVVFADAYTLFVKDDYGVLKKDHEELREDHAALQGSHNSMQAVYKVRVKFLDDKDHENDSAHEFYDQSLLAMQSAIERLQDRDKANEKFKSEGLDILGLLSHKIAKLEKMAEQISSDDDEHVVSVTIKEVKELEELKSEEQDTPNLNLKIAALAKMVKSDNAHYSVEGSSDDEERVRSMIIKEDLDRSLSLRVKSNIPPVPHSLIPDKTLQFQAMRLRNLEIIVGCETTEQSFGPYAELKPSNIDKLANRIQEVIHRQNLADKWTEGYELNREALDEKCTAINQECETNAEAIEEMEAEVAALRENFKTDIPKIKQDMKGIKDFLALKFKGERI